MIEPSQFEELTFEQAEDVHGGTMTTAEGFGVALAGAGLIVGAIAAAPLLVSAGALGYAFGAGIAAGGGMATGTGIRYILIR